MAKRKKDRGGRRVRSGQGWEFIPANRAAAANPALRCTSDAPESQRIKVRQETRKQKKITVARGFRLSDADLKALAKKLKVSCSAGGKSEDDRIEIQGQHVEKVVAELVAAGFPAESVR